MKNRNEDKTRRLGMGQTGDLRGVVTNPLVGD